MKVAATYDAQSGNVFQHFGHTQAFKIFEIENGEVKDSKVIDNGGFGHHDLATYLKNLGVEVLILGNRGQGAIDALNSAGIKQFAGVTGSADEAACAFAKGTLVHNDEAKCNHNHEHHNEPKFTLVK